MVSQSQPRRTLFYSGQPTSHHPLDDLLTSSRTRVVPAPAPLSAVGILQVTTRRATHLIPCTIWSIARPRPAPLVIASTRLAVLIAIWLDMLYARCFHFF
jgi:hypothetical protein